jgi:hypothetical protein
MGFPSVSSDAPIYEAVPLYCESFELSYCWKGGLRLPGLQGNHVPAQNQQTLHTGEPSKDNCQKESIGVIKARELAITFPFEMPATQQSPT